LEAGKLDDYRQACEALSTAAAEARDDVLTRRLAAACTLAPNALPDLQPLLAAFDRTLVGSVKYPEDVRIQCGLLLRAGQPAEAVKRWKIARFDPFGGPHEDLLMALAFHQLKQPAWAKLALTHAVDFMEWRPRQLSAGNAVLSGTVSPLHALTALQQPTLPDD